MQAAVRRETRADPGGPRAAAPVGPPGAAGDAVRAGRRRRRRAARGADLRVRRARPGARTRPSIANACAPSGARRCARSARLDAVGRRDAPAFENAPNGIVTLRNVMADWSVRLLVGALLLPVLLAALDAFFRARRRRVPIAPWIGWLVVAAVPLPVAWLWLRVLAATGLVDAPAGLARPAPLAGRDERDRRGRQRDRRGRAGLVRRPRAGARDRLAAERRGDPERPSRARRARGGRSRRRDRGVAVRAGGARVGAQPLRRGPAGPRRAPVAVRRHRLARVEGGGRARCVGPARPRPRARAPQPRARTRPAASSCGRWRSRP